MMYKQADDFGKSMKITIETKLKLQASFRDRNGMGEFSLTFFEKLPSYDFVWQLYLLVRYAHYLHIAKRLCRRGFLTAIM